MGTTHVTAQVLDLARTGRPFEADFLVDTDSPHCLAPASRLREAGVEPEGEQVYELASGEPVEYEYGFARVSFLGSETVTHVIFGPEDAEPLLGAVALENTGVAGPREPDFETLAGSAAQVNDPTRPTRRSMPPVTTKPLRSSGSVRPRLR